MRGHQHGCDLIHRCKKCVPVWHPNGTFSLFRWFHTYFILWCVGSLPDFYHWMSNLWNFEQPQWWELPRHGASKKRWTGCISLLQLSDAVYFLASLAPKYFCQPTIMRQRRSSHRIDESKRCNKLVALILTSMRHLGFLIRKLVPDDCVVQAPIKKGAGKSSQNYVSRCGDGRSFWVDFGAFAGNVGILCDAPPPSTGKGQGQYRDAPYAKCLNIYKNPVSYPTAYCPVDHCKNPKYRWNIGHFESLKL